MFKVTGSASTDCEGLVRRSFVQAGVLGLGGLTLAEFLKLRAASGGDSPTIRPHQSDTSVILIWMSGGPGHHETWDPKPQAISEYRGPFGAISTTAPGVQFSETLPEQAKIAEHLSVIRTVSHGTGDHTKGNHWMLPGVQNESSHARKMSASSEALDECRAARFSNSAGSFLRSNNCHG